ncbi:MAG: choice-of-anchor D domain-containing protein [Thermoanaerobaculales bacterium]
MNNRVPARPLVALDVHREVIMVRSPKTRFLYLVLFALGILLVVAAFLAADAVTYTYDANGRLLKADYGGGNSVTYTYDKAGNILTAASSSPDNTLRVFVSPPGAGGVVGPNIACPSSCVHAFSGSQQVTLTGAPQAGFKLLAWGGDLFSTANPFAFTLDTDRNLTAYFGALSGMTVPAKGIPDVAEFGPAGDNPGYDGNGDGIPDYQQPNVASFPTAAGGGYVTLAVPSGQALANVSAVTNPHPADAPGMKFLYGFFAFTVTGVGPTGVVATLYLPKNAAIVKYYKYGPTPDNHDPHWYEFPFNGTTGAEIVQDSSQTRIVLHLVDAARGDDVVTSTDGMVIDAGGPAAQAAPLIMANPSTVNFTNVPKETTATQTITVSNNGDANLIIGSLGDGSLAAPFGIQSENCSSATLQPQPTGGTCTITVRFAPTATGHFTDGLAIPSNDPTNSSLAVQVQGDGVATEQIPALGGIGLALLAALLAAIALKVLGRQ